MAATMRSSSFLPSIKCSSCGIDIEISMMGDHVCAQRSLVSQTRQKNSNNYFASINGSSSNSSSITRPGRVPPPRIDASAASMTFRILFSKKDVANINQIVRTCLPINSVTPPAYHHLPLTPHLEVAVNHRSAYHHEVQQLLCLLTHLPQIFKCPKIAPFPFFLPPSHEVRRLPRRQGNTRKASFGRGLDATIRILRPVHDMMLVVLQDKS